MAKSSINFQKASEHSFDHNFRKDKPNYLLPKEFQKENEFWKHEKTEKQIFEEELSKANRKGGRKPKLENSRWEAVLNLNANHKLEDIKKVAERIEKKFNITCASIAIHRDEGFVQNDKPQYNYHAHINFITYKDGRQNWRREHIKPKNLSELQTEIANLLQMERGQENSKAKRLNHSQYKAVAKEREKALATQTLLKAEVKQLREELKEAKAVRSDYAELEELNRLLKEKIRKKELSEIELRREIEKLRVENQKKPKTIEKIVEVPVEVPVENTEKIEKLEKIVDVISADMKELVEVATGEKIPEVKRTHFIKAKEKLSEQKKELIEARESTKALQIENESLKSRLSVSERDMNDLSTKNEELTEKVSVLETENTSLKRENLSLNAERSEKERALKAEIQEYEVQNKEIQTTFMQIYKAEKAENSEVPSKFNAFLKYVAAKFQQLKEQIKQLKEEKEQMKMVVEYPGVKEFYQKQVFETHQKMEREIKAQNQDQNLSL